MQEVKLCFSLCRALNKRSDIGTPGAELQGGSSSGEAAGGRVHAKVIFFFALAGNGRSSALAGNSRSSAAKKRTSLTLRATGHVLQ